MCVVHNQQSHLQVCHPHKEDKRGSLSRNDEECKSPSKSVSSPGQTPLGIEIPNVSEKSAKSQEN